jgi:hypothetical protein
VSGPGFDSLRVHYVLFSPFCSFSSWSERVVVLEAAGESYGVGTRIARASDWL